MTIRRGGFRVLHQLRDRGFPFLRRLQEFREINLSAIRPNNVGPVLFPVLYSAPHNFGDGIEVADAGLGPTEPVYLAPSLVRTGNSPR